ncbi:hypothetical protein D9M68_894780 [compost metagenome]
MVHAAEGDAFPLLTMDDAAVLFGQEWNAENGCLLGADPVADLIDWSGALTGAADKRKGKQ